MMFYVLIIDHYFSNVSLAHWYPLWLLICCCFNQDLHLAIEIFIEAVFDIFHKAAHFILSPSTAFRIVRQWFSSDSGNKDTDDDDVYDTDVQTATLGESDPAVTEKPSTFHQSMNTDARTCQDVITELGYSLECSNVWMFLCLICDFLNVLNVYMLLSFLL